MKRFLTLSVVAATIAWSLGLAGLAPQASAAYTPADGDIIKVATNPAVYYILGGKRLLFSNRVTYGSWFADFSTLKVIDQADFDAIPSGGNVTVRPAANLIKFDNSSTVYAVATGNKICKITSADAAKALYGDNWSASVVTIQVAFEGNYTVDATCELTATSKYPAGSLIKASGSSDIYYWDGTSRRLVSSEAFIANGFKSSLVKTVADVTAYGTLGAALTAKEAAIAAPSAPAGSTTPVTTGSVNVSLASDSPAAANLASGSAFNSILKVNLTAGSAEATVSGLTLKKAGFAANTAVSGIDVVDQTGKRYGNVASSINSDNEVNLIFSNDPIKVAAGQTVTLTVRVNITANETSGTLQLGLASASAVTAGGTVSGSFPIWSNTMGIILGSNSLGVVTLDAQPINSTGASLNIDESSAQEIAKFRIAETASKEAVRVKGLTLYNNGNASDTDYKDVELVTSDGTVLATAQPKGQYITFSGLSYLIDKGYTKDLTVRAKIIGGTTRTIQFTVYNDYDLMVMGESTGAYILATAGASVDSSFPIGDPTTVYNKVTVDSGTATFGKDTTSPNVAVAPGTTNTVLAKFYVKPTGEDMELRTISLGIVPSGATALTGSVYVKVNDASVWSDSATNVTSSASMSSVTLQSYPTLKSGVTSYITVVGSVSTNATSGDAYKVYLDVNNVKRLATNDIVDAGVAADSGNTISVQAASLKATTLSTPVAQTTVAGSDFEFANFELNAQNSGEDVKVSRIVISDVVANGGAVSQISNLRLYQGSTLLETSNSTASASASTTFTFKSPIVVTKGSSVTLKLLANISNVSDSDDTHTFSIASGDVTAVGASTGNTISGSALTYSGTGQAITLATTGSATASLVSGSGASPSSDQLINVGTNDGIYFSFKLTASNEALKMRTIKVTATSTATTSLNINALRNIRLLANGTVVATANQMDSCSAGVCTITFTSSDNLFGATTVGTSASTAVTVAVKADIGVAGTARLGDNFRFYVASSTTDLLGVGASSGSSASITGTPTVSAVTYVNPFSVVVSGIAPTTVTTVGTAAGITLGVFKVTNNGSAPITLTKAQFTDGGASTSTKVYGLYASGDGGAQSDVTASTGGTATSTTANFTTSMTINGGSWRYLTVKQTTASANNDTYQLTANSSVGNFTFSVSESDLGYDANGDGDRSDTSTGLNIVGNPTVEMVTAKN